jgi:tRNA(Arg) A34 adenosine deaminase TadA
MSKHKLTAIIYDRRGRVLSIGQNNYLKSHPYQASLAKQVRLPEKIYLHAEINAIIKCPDLSRAYRIFISRFDQLGNARLAKPCPVCDEAIRLSGIKYVEYTG